MCHYRDDNRSMPEISFMFAQIHDSNWRELKDYTVHWQGNQIIFPRIPDIDSVCVVGKQTFGPEDPRLIMEEGQEEPVIIFNQIDDITFEPNERAMFLHKPCSNITTVLKIQNRECRGIEKNWAPLFLKQRSSSTQGSPSKFMWFVYNYEPLQILKCQISSGHCKFVYQQQNIVMPWELHKLGRLYGNTYGSISGGTNYIPISKSSGHRLQSSLLSQEVIHRLDAKSFFIDDFFPF